MNSQSHSKEAAARSDFVDACVGIPCESAGILRRWGRCATVPLVLSLATAVVFWQQLLHPSDLLVGPQNGGQNDLTAAFLLFRQLPGILVSEGASFPGWNPHTLGGAPWLGNPQAALFYPPNWIPVFWHAPAVISWLMVLHHLFAGAGAYLLARRYQLTDFAALAAGILLIGAPYFLAHTAEGHFNQTCVASWIPWILLTYERFRERQRVGIALLAISIALAFLAGHVQELYYLLLLLTAFILWDAAGDAWRGQSAVALSQLVRWFGVAIISLLLVGVDLLPILTYSKQTVRREGISLTEAGISPGWENLTQLWQPFALGGPADYQGPGVMFWESLIFFGRIPLLLAICGAISGMRQREMRRLLFIVLFGLAFSLGNTLPLFPLCYEWIPGIGSFRAPGRMQYLASAALAILAAGGIDSLQRVARTTAERLGLLQTGRAAAIAKYGAMTVLVGGILAELTWFSNVVFRTIPAEAVRQNIIAEPTLRNSGGTRRVLASQRHLSDREAARANLSKLQGYEPVPLLHTVVAADALTLSGHPGEFLLGFDRLDPGKLNPHTLDLLGITHLVAEPSVPPPAESWKLVEEGQVSAEFTLRGARPRELHFSIYEHTSVMPRAYVVGQPRRLLPGEEVVEVLRSIEPRREVLLQTDPLPPSERSEFRAAKIVSYRPNEVRIEAETASPGYLVLSDTWYPGWRATVNGREMPVLRANVAFRAVPLTAGGKHIVVMSYTPPGLVLGGLLSLLGVLLTLLGLSFRPKESHVD